MAAPVNRKELVQLNNMLEMIRGQVEHLEKSRLRASDFQQAEIENEIERLSNYSIQLEAAADQAVAKIKANHRVTDHVYLSLTHTMAQIQMGMNKQGPVHLTKITPEAIHKSPEALPHVQKANQIVGQNALIAFNDLSEHLTDQINKLHKMTNVDQTTIQTQIDQLEKQLMHLEEVADRAIHHAKKQPHSADKAFIELSSEIQKTQRQLNNRLNFPHIQVVLKRMHSTPISKMLPQDASVYQAVAKMQTLFVELRHSLNDYEKKALISRDNPSFAQTVFKGRSAKGRIQESQALQKQLNEWKSDAIKIQQLIVSHDSAHHEKIIQAMIKKLTHRIENDIKSQEKGLKNHFFSGNFTQILNGVKNDLKSIKQIVAEEKFTAPKSLR